jgi:lipopolysaccharide/colanic/teichoic acid biosynthesis glycosyltransferase
VARRFLNYSIPDPERSTAAARQIRGDAAVLCGGRPVLFRPIRIARAGGLMQIMKLRTTTAQDPDADWTVPPDQGTRLGRLLRSTHLDDLPQFLNVIRGQMSLVGPRPERPHFT